MASRTRPPRRLYEPTASFVVRAPLLPVQQYLALADDPDPAGPAPDRAKDPVVHAALCAATPDLLAELERPHRDPRDAAGPRSALLRYLIRMSTRPTPFGLFAGIGVGAWGGATELRLDAGPRRATVRPDMGWLLGLVLAAERGGAQRLVRNPCVFEAGGRIHLSDRATAGHTDRPDVSIRATPAVRRVFAHTRTPVDRDQLVDRVLAQTPGATRDQVAGLVDQLAGLDLLLSGLRPPLTGDPVAHVVDGLAAQPGARATAARLAAVGREAVEAGRLLSAADPAASTALTALRGRIRAVHTAEPAVEPAAGTDVVQVDAALALAGSTLHDRVAADAVRAVDLLLAMHPAPGGPRHLAAYRAAFVGRFGTHRPVPVLELLDPRFGLGPPGRGHVRTPATPSGARRAERLLDLAAAALRDHAAEVVLDDDDVDALSTWRPEPERLPVSLELSAFVAAESAPALDRGDYLLVVGPNLGAQAAGRGIGRFASLLGAPAAALLAEVGRAEDARRGEGVAAELTYLPTRHRSTNVAVRPATRAYEIPVGVGAGVAPDRVIPVDELAVYVDGGRLRLWWTARGVPVSVSASHMLNTISAPAVCRFLHEIGSDGVTPLAPFDWGPAASLPALPRVRAGRVVLRPAQWRLRPRSTALHADDRVAFPAALARWRQRWGVPRRAYLAAGDNRLLLDLDDAAQAEQLRRELRKGRGRDVILQEALPGPEHAWLAGPDGGYLSELVVPLVRRAPHTPTASAGAVRTPVTGDDRRRPPGSDWLYLTLYGPRAGQDELVAGPLRAFAGDLLATGRADGWFFLRYADPDPHLRLRLHGDPAVLLAEVLPAATAWAAGLVAEGVLRRIGLDVYEREVERYGGPAAIADAEAVFVADSAAVAELLDGDMERIELAVLGFDALLAALGYDPAARLHWCREVAPPPRESAAAYRERGRRLRDLLGGAARDEPAVAVARAVLARRTAAIAPAAGRLARLAADDRLTAPPSSVARSLVHMHANRLGLDQAAEGVALGLLRRTLDSLRAAPR